MSRRGTHGFMRVALFAGGLFIAAAAYSVVRLLHLPTPLMLTGLSALLVTEWLIWRRHLWRAGIDEALGGAGALLLAVGIANAGHLSDRGTAWAVAVALALAGFRLLQPLFTTVAAVACTTALSLTLVPSLFGINRTVTMQMSALCFVAAAVALAAGARTCREPAFTRMLDGLVIVLPPVGYLWAASFQGLLVVPPGLPLWSRLYLSLVPLFFGVTALWIGLRRRRHAPLHAALLCLACVCWQQRTWLPAAWHWWLIIFGGATLLVTVALDRWLRTPRHGITSRSDARHHVDEVALELAGVAIASPVSQSSQTTRGSGGGFGGGGAEGRW